MHLLSSIILLLTLVVISNVINHYVVAIPVSLIQAGIGLLVALIFAVKIDMDTDWFMLLFIAPLLFNDGRHFPKRELWALRGPIIGNAIVLVVITTLAGGWFIHWLIPAMPLSAAFALAAILSPTDPIAVQSIAQRVHLPQSILNLVSGESLINDASGLICFKYGISATVTGTFALGHAISDFFYIAIIGALAGAGLMIAINLIRVWLLKRGLDDVILHTVMNILTPLLIYMIVDEGMHASGVIAVVIAGLINNAEGNRYIQALQALPELKIVTERTWDIIVYVLNGVIFLLLGIELPAAMTATIKAREVNTGQALLDVVLVYLFVLALRTLWVWSYQKLGRLSSVNFKTALLSGLSGVRGAITLVGVLAVPLTLADGSVFPERNLMLFIAAGFVVLSLIVAVIALPLVSKSRKPLRLRGSAPFDNVVETPSQAKLMSPESAQRFLYQTAVSRLATEKNERNEKPALDLIQEYQTLIRKIDIDQNVKLDSISPILKDELLLYQVGLTGEQKTLETQRTHLDHELYTKVAQLFNQRQEEIQVMLTNKGKRTLRMYLARWSLVQKHKRSAAHMLREKDSEAFQAKLSLEKELATGGLAHLSHHLDDNEGRYNQQVADSILTQYRNRIVSATNNHFNHSNKYEGETERLRSIALAAERSAIHDLREQGLIDSQLAADLSQRVNNTETAQLLTTTE